MRDSSIISLSSEFLMSRDNKKGIPLRIFFQFGAANQINK